ncbi:hypothetical protein [Sphingomonas sp. R86521]|uniref:hypothetical protein n=1 Tax=Sphingomonas sp. R86521 TaxID=3093860 RepID=UPI0036D2F34E
MSEYEGPIHEVPREAEGFAALPEPEGAVREMWYTRRDARKMTATPGAERPASDINAMRARNEPGKR